MATRSSFPTMMTIALLSIASVPVALAQASQLPAEQSAPSYSDAELKSFAVALLEVQRINDAYLPQLKAAKTTEEQQQVEEKASQEMEQAVRTKGLSVDKYKEILTRAQSNPEVAERVKQHLKAAQ